MNCGVYGRLGETRVGSRAPTASTSCSSREAWNVRTLETRGLRRAPPLWAQRTRRRHEDELQTARRGIRTSADGRKSGIDQEGLAEAAVKDSQSPGLEAASGNWIARKWAGLAPQYQLVFAAAWAFVICNMDKVNISVAIINMSQEFHWNSTTSGFVQSSFFAGYMFTQIPGGYIVSRLGGRKVLPTGVTAWSAATAATPFLAGTLPGIFFCRVVVGLGEGVAPTSATDMVARVCKQNERSRALAFIFSGLHVGSLAGLLVAPLLIEKLGWPAVFYMFGLVGLVWSFWWESLMGSIKDRDPAIARKLESSMDDPGRSGGKAAPEDVPWRGILRNKPVLALAYVHFCNNWAAYTMTAWLPSYFSDSLSLDLTQASQAALFPPIAAIAASSIAGPAVDYVISRGAPVGPVRKTAQAVAFIGPAIFLGLACKLAGGGADNEMLTVALISGALGLASVSVAGLYSNHADLSSRQASLLLGLTSTMGAIPGIVGVTLTGVIFDKTHEWNWALFAPPIFFYLTGTVVFTLFGSAEQQAFDDDTPFWFEKYFRPVVRQAKRIPIASTSTSVLAKAQAVADKWKGKR